MSKLNLSDTAKQLFISILATVISIILTFGVAHLVEKNRQKEKRRQMSMMVIHDIDETVNNIKELLKNEESGWEATRYCMDHKDNLKAVSRDTLVNFLNYIISVTFNANLRFDKSNESIFNSSQDSWNTLSDMSFIRNVQKCYHLRSILEDQLANWVYFKRPINEEESYQILMNSDVLFEDNSFYSLCEKWLSDERTKYYMDNLENRKFLLNYVLENCLGLNEANKFLTNVTDEELKEFAEKTLGEVRRATEKTIAGKWLSVSGDDSSIEMDFKVDHTLACVSSYMVTSSIFYGKISLDAKRDGRWEIIKDSLILHFDPESFSLIANDSSITYKPEMKDSIKSIIKDLTSPEMVRRMKSEVFPGERISCTTNLDPTGKKLEITTNEGASLHLAR
ncbi:MAG: hypothetical protein IK041_00305 [Bacteroidales bacterium]|nr:hypothetical protein [Bacteroidales bacterium]